MLSPEHVAELARAEGLDDHAEELVRRVRPGWRLDVDRGADAANAGVSKIGGQPDLAAGEEWPLNERGVPLTFLAQVDCSSLPRFDPVWVDPHPWAHGDRLVRLFADLIDNPFEPGLARALTCDPAEALTRTVGPPVPDPLPAGGEWDELPPEERFLRLPEVVVRPTPFLSAPETHPVLRPTENDSSPAADRYHAWSNRLRLDGDPPRDYPARAPWEVHHLLGEACSIQDDVRATGTMFYGEVEEEADWRVLLALHDDESLGLDILDGGAFTVLAPVEDLAAGRYHRLVCSVDSS